MGLSIDCPEKLEKTFTLFLYSRSKCDDSRKQTLLNWKMFVYDVHSIIEVELKDSK